MKKVIAIALAGVLGLGGLLLPNLTKEDCLVLKVANWAEYIDEGDDTREDMVTRFESWYEDQTNEKIRVEYCIADDNETLYNMIKMGDQFDLVCPSEYMIMKLSSEDRLQKLPDSFYDKSIETNYYAKHVSPFIEKTFKANRIEEDTWDEYAAGYMWGVTGFVYHKDATPTVEEDVKSWDIFLDPAYAQKITAKNNIRDTYFVGLALYYQEEIAALKTALESATITKQEYQTQLKQLMNDSSPETMDKVTLILKQLAGNLYGFETDEGKNEMLKGNIDVNYQWSGDASYLLFTEDEELAEGEEAKLQYAVPESVSNLWFDGWVLTKDCKNVDAATMFINFLSRPDNAVYNMDYIGYTTCIGTGAYSFVNDLGETEEINVFDYVLDYEVPEEEASEPVSYDLNYFFNPNYDENDESTRDEQYIFSTESEYAKRGLFSLFPTEGTLLRCVTMEQFSNEANQRANLMWSDITFF